MSYKEGKQAENEELFTEAILYYDDLFPSNFKSLHDSDLVELMVFYWQLTDYGFSIANGIVGEYFDKAAQRMTELQSWLQFSFPDSTLARFWIEYTRWITLGEGNISVDECKHMLEECPSVLDPAFVVYGFSVGREGESSAMKLLALHLNQKSLRSKYIVGQIYTTQRTILMKKSRQTEEKPSSMRR